MLLMIDNYDSFTFNLVQYFGELGEDVRTYRNDEITLEQIQAELKLPFELDGRAVQASVRQVGPAQWEIAQGERVQALQGHGEPAQGGFLVGRAAPGRTRASRCWAA